MRLRTGLYATLALLTGISSTLIFSGKDSETSLRPTSISLGNTQCQPYLCFSVAELGQVLDAVKHRPLVCHAGVQEVLLSRLVHADPLEDQPLREARLERADLEEGHHVQLGGAHGSQVLRHAAPEDGHPAGGKQGEGLGFGKIKGVGLETS
jgi:hypothetical protein